LDTPGLRRKVITKLLTGPSFLLPMVAGLSTLVVGFSAGMDPIVTSFAGVSAMLIGVGALATRAIYRLDDLARRAISETQAEEAADAQRKLDDLYRRLAAEKDLRAAKLLDGLRATYAALREALTGNDSIPRPQLMEVSQKAEQLFTSCIASLQHALEMLQASRGMSTQEARSVTIGRRERLLDEVEESAAHLSGILDKLRAFGIEDKDSENLAILRSELDESLSVARKVEERMQAFQSELDRTTTGADRAVRE
jgi:hypothetical protein